MEAGRRPDGHAGTGVMPEGFSKGHPALGQSFLRNFNYKIDSDAATLTMTKIETD